MLDVLLTRRIEFLRKNIRLRDVMRHFGHNYRTHGNMLCPFHQEKNPSSRLYDDQDTFWCWTCSPNHGVDVIEYVILEFSLEDEVDPNKHLTPQKKHALATFQAIEYLEEAFDVSYASTPWEKRLHESLRRKVVVNDPKRYWRVTNIHVLRLMAQIKDTSKWMVYSNAMHTLTVMKTANIDEQLVSWNKLRKELSALS